MGTDDRNKNGSIPEIDRELDRLKQMGIIGRDFLKGIYDDFYAAPGAAKKTSASGSGKGSGTPSASFNGSGTPSASFGTQKKGAGKMLASGTKTDPDKAGKPPVYQIPEKQEGLPFTGQTQIPAESSCFRESIPQVQVCLRIPAGIMN